MVALLLQMDIIDAETGKALLFASGLTIIFLLGIEEIFYRFRRKK